MCISLPKINNICLDSDTHNNSRKLEKLILELKSLWFQKIGLNFQLLLELSYEDIKNTSRYIYKNRTFIMSNSLKKFFVSRKIVVNELIFGLKFCINKLLRCTKFQHLIILKKRVRYGSNLPLSKAALLNLFGSGKICEKNLQTGVFFFFIKQILLGIKELLHTLIVTFLLSLIYNK